MKEYHTYRGPYMNSKNKTTKMMRNVLIALFPIIAFAFYKNGVLPYLEGKTNLYGMLYPLLFMTISTLTCYLIEFFYMRFAKKLKGRELGTTLLHSYAFFPGLFLSLILPLNTPIGILIFGSFMATVFGKLIYGGFGYNIFNPALIGRLFIITLYATVITSHGGYLNPSEIDAVTSATPLANISMVSGIGTYETVVAPYGSLLDFFFGTIPGSMGETSALLCLLGFLFLGFTRTIKVKIPITYISTVFIMTFIIGFTNNVGIWYPLFQVLSGGLFFGAVFMATDPVTTPVTPTGQVLFGIGLGILTVIFRYLTPYPEGVLTSILLMNMMVVILDKLGAKVRGKALPKVLIIIVMILIASLLSLGIASKYKVTEENVDPNFSLIETKENNGVTTYIVTQKGNGGAIKAAVTIENDKIIKYEIINHNETPAYFKLVEDASYIDKLINNQDKLNEVDTVSGATVSSNALKKLLINVEAIHEKK